MAGADLSDPGVIREFRGRLLRFQQQAEAILGTAGNLLTRTQDRLRLELHPYWKKQLSRRQEAHAEARRRWLEAEFDVKAAGRRGSIDKASSIEERREMLKAQRRVEEAEEKLADISRWLTRLDGDGKDLHARCRDHELGIHDMCNQAAADLDRRIGAIEDYLRRTTGGTA